MRDTRTSVREFRSQQNERVKKKDSVMKAERFKGACKKKDEKNKKKRKKDGYYRFLTKGVAAFICCRRVELQR